MDIGEALRQARARKKLRINEVAQTTKIPASTLEAMESNQFERLPAAIYTRSFLRQYAREVGLDPKELVEQYLQQYTVVTPLGKTPPEVESSPADVSPEPRRVRTIVIPRALPFSALAVAVVVAAVASYVTFGSRPNDPNDATIAHANTAADVAPAVAPPAAAVVPDATRAGNVIPDGLHLELIASGPCWVSATADRVQVVSRLLHAGENQTIEGKDELVVRLGDPGSVSVKINGAPARPLGNAGRPVTVLINKQNFKELLLAS